jgi:hypothetical protein
MNGKGRQVIIENTGLYSRKDLRKELAGLRVQLGSLLRRNLVQREDLLAELSALETLAAKSAEVVHRSP